jgi:hypothetical protein
VITTRIATVLRGRREHLVEDVEPVLLEDQLHDVSLLEGARRNRDEPDPIRSTPATSTFPSSFSWLTDFPIR